MEDSNKRKLETLTLKDSFMFGAVMTEPENCRPFLEMALEIPIGKLTVSIDKSLVYLSEYVSGGKWIRPSGRSDDDVPEHPREESDEIPETLER